MDSLMWHLAAAGLVLNTSKTPALRAEEAQRFSLFGNTELHKRLGSMWTTICNKHPRFSRHTFECYNARIAPSNTGQTTLFPGNCLFNSLFRCRAPTIIQKIRRSTSQICSTHRGTSTRHELVGAMAWYFAWDLPTVWITGRVPVVKLFDGQRVTWFCTGISLRTLRTYPPNARCGEHLRGIRFHHILVSVAHKKFGTLHWKCSAGSQLSTVVKLLRGTRSVGMRGFHLSLTLFHVNVASTFSERCCRLYSFWCT